jgi:Protein of unknown function (DUF1579)
MNIQRSFSIVLLTVGLLPLIARSDDKPKAPTTDQAAMMDEYMKMGAPGPEHDMLKQMVGDWNAEAKFWEPDGTPGTPTTGVMHYKLILGDRFLQANYEGEIALPTGKIPFHGMALIGYDRGKKKYTSVWIDESSTGMMTTEGTSVGNVTTLEGQLTEPMSGQPMNVKEVITNPDKDHEKYELYMSDATGKLNKMMEINYTRK